MHFTLSTLIVLFMIIPVACAGLFGNLENHDHSSISQGGSLAPLPTASVNGQTISTASLNLVDIPSATFSLSMRRNHHAIVNAVVVANQTAGATPIQVRVACIELVNGIPTATLQSEDVITVAGVGGRISIPLTFISSQLVDDEVRDYKLQAAVNTGTVYFEVKRFWGLSP